MESLGKWFRNLLGSGTLAVAALSAPDGLGDYVGCLQKIVDDKPVCRDVFESVYGLNLVILFFVDNAEKVGCVTIFVERKSVLNASHQNEHHRPFIFPISNADGLGSGVYGLLVDAQPDLIDEVLVWEDRIACPDCFALLGLREIGEDFIWCPSPIDNELRLHMGFDCGAFSNVLASNQNGHRSFVLTPNQGRCNLNQLDRHPWPLVSDERLSGQPIGFGVRVSRPGRKEQHQYQKADFNPGDDNLSPRQPSKLLCSLRHSPLLASIAIAAFLGLIAGVFLWKAVGHHIERGLLDRRAIGWFSSALGVYALAILLAIVSSQAYKYKTGINRYYCAYQASSNLSV